MPKIDVSKVAEILKKNALQPALLRRLIEEMNIAVQSDNEEEKLQAVKKQFAIVISDPEGKLPKHDFVGWVIQLPENESVVTVPDRVFRAVYDFNASKKGRLLPVKSVGEAFENVPARHFKDADLWVKTKTPVLMLRTNNEIPKE